MEYKAIQLKVIFEHEQGCDGDDITPPTGGSIDILNVYDIGFDSQLDIMDEFAENEIDEIRSLIDDLLDDLMKN